MRRISVVIAEEQPNARKALRSLLASQPDIVIVGEVNNGFDALDVVGNLHPDVLLFGLDASNIVEIVQLANNRFPDTVIVVRRKGHSEDHTLEMMRAGVNIRVLRSDSPAKLVKTIREAKGDQESVGRRISETAVGKKKSRSAREFTSDPYDILTPREFEVFRLVISGLTNAMIADRLSISRRTVEIHRANMMRKLGLRNQYRQLLKYAVERGVLLDSRQDK